MRLRLLKKHLLRSIVRRIGARFRPCCSSSEIKSAQVNTEDEEEVEEVMWLSDDEKIVWEEE